MSDVSLFLLLLLLLLLLLTDRNVASVRIERALILAANQICERRLPSIALFSATYRGKSSIGPLDWSVQKLYQPFDFT